MNVIIVEVFKLKLENIKINHIENCLRGIVKSFKKKVSENSKVIKDYKKN